MMEHLPPELLFDAASGDTLARHRSAPHLSSCGFCRKHLALLMGILDTARQILGVERSMCPPVEQIATMDRGSEEVDTHLRDCPLCRVDLALIRDLENRRRVEEAVAGWCPQRVAPVVQARSRQRLVAGLEKEHKLDIGQDTEGTIRIAGVRFFVRVHGGMIRVRVEGHTETPLVLCLENDFMIMRLPLEESEYQLEIRDWTRLSIMRRDGD